MSGFLIKLAAIMLIGYVVWRAMRPRYTVKIVVDEQGIKHHEGLPKACERTVLEFIEKNLSPEGKVTICASRQPNGYLRLDFRGQLDSGTRQRIRNFLITVI